MPEKDSKKSSKSDVKTTFNLQSHLQAQNAKTVDPTKLTALSPEVVCRGWLHCDSRTQLTPIYIRTIYHSLKNILKFVGVFNEGTQLKF